MNNTRDITRCLPFTVERSEDDGDGLTMSGYSAVFNQPARIDSWEGKFDEVILPGAFGASLERQTPVLMFDHGKHPLIGSIPIGRYTSLREDEHGLHVEARFHNNWLTEPIRDAIREKSITGMSFRFVGGETDDRWTNRTGDVPLREIVSTSVPEMGPVVFPAYKGTEVAVRSQLFRQMMSMGTPDDDEDIVELFLDCSKYMIGELAAAIPAAQSPDLVAWLQEELTDTQTDINELTALGAAFAGEEDEPAPAGRNRNATQSSGAEGAPDEQRDGNPIDYGRANAVRLLQRTPFR